MKVVKPIVTLKSSATWNSFSHIYVNLIKQEYIVWSSDTNLLSKHIRICQNIKTTVSNAQTSINQFYASVKNESVIPARIRQEIKVACVEFAAITCRSFKTITGTGFNKYLTLQLINIHTKLEHDQCTIAEHGNIRWT